MHKDFWTSTLTAKQKTCYLIGFVFNITIAARAFLSPLPAPLILWSRPDLFKYFNSFFAFPSLFLDFIVFRIWTRARYTLSVQYVQVIMSYAFVLAIWDTLTGNNVT